MNVSTCLMLYIDIIHIFIILMFISRFTIPFSVWDITNKDTIKWQRKQFHADPLKSPSCLHVHIFCYTAFPGGSTILSFENKEYLTELPLVVPLQSHLERRVWCLEDTGCNMSPVLTKIQHGSTGLQLLTGIN